MSDTKPGLEDEIAFLRDEITSAKTGVRDFQKRHLNGQQEDCLIYCLKRAIDISEGCLLAADTRLPESAAVLGRGLFEILIEVNWITFSKENAKKFAEATLGELKTNVREALKRGVGRVTLKATGEDKSQEFLSSPVMQDIPRRLQFGQMAKDVGLGKIFEMLYGFFSMCAHGFAYGIAEELALESHLDATTAASVATMRCINLVVTAWMVKRQRSTVSQIREVLGI